MSSFLPVTAYSVMILCSLNWKSVILVAEVLSARLLGICRRLAQITAAVLPGGTCEETWFTPTFKRRRIFTSKGRRTFTGVYTAGYIMRCILCIPLPSLYGNLPLPP